MKSHRPVYSIDSYLEQMQSILGAVSRDAVEANVSCLYSAWMRGKQVFVLGNGGSASTASHVANDLSKATIVPGKRRMRVISISDNMSLITAWANDTAFENVFKEQLENLLNPGDVVIGITASGNSPNVLRAMEFAVQKGAETVAWTGLSGGRVKDMVDCCIHAPTEDVGMIEGVHLIIDHVVTDLLRQRIEASSPEAVIVADVENAVSI